MKVSTYKAFEKLNGRIDVLEQKIDAIASALVNDEQLAALLADVKRKSADLKDALPKI